MEIIRGKHSWKSFMGNIRGNHFTPEAITKGSFTNCNRLLILFYIVETARNKEQLWSQNWPERLLRPRLPLKWATIPRATIPRLRETCDSKANWANRSPELRHLSTKWLKVWLYLLRFSDVWSQWCTCAGHFAKHHSVPSLVLPNQQ